MSQSPTNDKPTVPPLSGSEYSPQSYRKISQRRPGVSSLQKGRPKTTASGKDFANGGASQNARANLIHGDKNDYLQPSNFNNNYSGSTNYNGDAKHNDYKGSTNYNGSATHNDHKGATTNIYERREGEGKNSPLIPHSGYPGSYRTHVNDSNMGYQIAHRPSQGGGPDADYTNGFKDSSNDFDHLTTRASAEQSVESEDSGTVETEETENPPETKRATELRQCVELFIAESEGQTMPGLADALIKEGWDRKRLAHCDWSDVRYSYIAPEWKNPAFVELRQICREWSA